MPVQPIFPLLGEPVAIDLVNTRVCRDGPLVDLLDQPARLSAWLRAEYKRLPWVGEATAGDLVAVCQLRDAIDDLLRALRTHGQACAMPIGELNRALSQPGVQPHLNWSADGPRRIAAPASSQRATLLHTLAVNALDILTGPQAGRVRECAHPQCRLQFVARNPRRRWCSAALCGNRARVARHYQRHRTG